ncbi:MAG: hypothetical protein J1F33_07350 [Clostridiales bacterium]|nr:hypothetical protein [Clostridiales bacterium]
MKELVNITVLDAAAFLRAPIVDTSLSLKVVGAKSECKEVVKKLAKLYGDTEVKADGQSLRISELKLFDTVEVPPQTDFDKERYNAADARRVISRLMQKPGGCPWDSVQTHESIRINMVEEAYEAVDAIDKKDIEGMIEEFGDVFLQSLLQSEIARRDNEFDFDDVCDGLCKKLIGRHTFIFGGDSATSSDDALTLWEKNKAVEKKYDSVKTQLSKLPETFPALLYAQKIHKKTKKANGVGIAEADTSRNAEDIVKEIVRLAASLAELNKDAEVEVNSYLKALVKKL